MIHLQSGESNTMIFLFLLKVALVAGQSDCVKKGGGGHKKSSGVLIRSLNSDLHVGK